MINTRIANPATIDIDRIRAIANSGATPTVQFSGPGYTPELLQALNRVCAEFEGEIEVRFYGHYGSHFDASALAELPNARWVSIDCLEAITNAQEIAKLPLLNRLSFGVYRFDHPKFLETIDVSRLKELSLGETAKRNFDLEPLRHSLKLHTLWLEGHWKNVEVLSSLPTLEKLTLRAFPRRKNLQFLSDAVGLRSLKLVLGGRSSFDEFGHAALEELRVIRVRGLETLGSLSRFPRLERLEVEDQLKIQSIDLAAPSLRTIFLWNCKGLTEIKGVESLSELTELRASLTKLDLDLLANRNWPPSMKILALYSGSSKRNAAIRAMLDKRGYRESARSL